MQCCLPAELEGGQVEVDAPKAGAGKRMQLGLGGSWEAAARLPVLGLCLQDQLHVIETSALTHSVLPQI